MPLGSRLQGIWIVPVLLLPKVNGTGIYPRLSADLLAFKAIRPTVSLHS
jgi:hypothetical protein